VLRHGEIRKLDVINDFQLPCVLQDSAVPMGSVPGLARETEMCPENCVIGTVLRRNRYGPPPTEIVRPVKGFSLKEIERELTVSGRAA